MKRSYIVVAAIALASAALGIVVSTQRWSPDPPQDSATAALFRQSLPDAQAAIQPLSQWQGKTLVVNFWATWCAPCVDEMPELSALQQKSASKNIQIIGIGIDSAGNIKDFSLKHKITYPLYVAGVSGTELARKFGNQAGGLPFTVLVSPSGEVQKTYLGRLKMDELEKDLGLSL
ncbi:TlpA disulfide reductase family protein [Oxalobacteraceae bacterium R-40]|uniref:TlpA disulfide reductase family protein n=1 Tax=Keguizhuia sedimenti TaxID=3064264 RepID=A0ABU1BTI2_9BURK|nr:TlpA disulfide reductase family protein [Oxalobacteraceae bacterium R-40]